MSLKTLIPRTTQPLTKMIRTLEGWIVLGANAALIIVPIVTNSLSAAQAVKYGAILDSVAIGARTALKAVAQWKQGTSLDPITPAVDLTVLQADAEKTATLVTGLQGDLAEAEAEIKALKDRPAPPPPPPAPSAAAVAAEIGRQLAHQSAPPTLVQG